MPRDEALEGRRFVCAGRVGERPRSFQFLLPLGQVEGLQRLVRSERLPFWRNGIEHNRFPGCKLRGCLVGRDLIGGLSRERLGRLCFRRRPLFFFLERQCILVLRGSGNRRITARLPDQFDDFRMSLRAGDREGVLALAVSRVALGAFAQQKVAEIHMAAHGSEDEGCPAFVVDRMDTSPRSEMKGDRFDRTGEQGHSEGRPDAAPMVRDSLQDQAPGPPEVSCGRDAIRQASAKPCFFCRTFLPPAVGTRLLRSYIWCESQSVNRSLDVIAALDQFGI